MLDVVELSLLMPVYPKVMGFFFFLCSGQFSFSLFHHRYAHLCCKLYNSLLDPWFSSPSHMWVSRLAFTTSDCLGGVLQASQLLPLLFLISFVSVLLMCWHNSSECFLSFILNVQLVSVKLHIPAMANSYANKWCIFQCFYIFWDLFLLDCAEILMGAVFKGCCQIKRQEYLCLQICTPAAIRE